MARFVRRGRVARRAHAVVRYAAPIARRAGSAAANAARDEKHTLIALGTAAAAGYARREGMLDTLPHLETLGVEGTYGAIAWALGKWTGNRTARHVATGLLCIAVNRMAAEAGTTP